MSKKTCDNALHDALWQYLSSIDGGMPVFDYRPPENVGYPFADIESMTAKYSDTKTGAMTSIEAVVNFWHKQHERTWISEQCTALLEHVGEMEAAFDRPIMLDMNQTTAEIVRDTSVKPAILRGRVALYIRFL